MEADVPAATGGESKAPPSPGVSPVHLTDCIEELLRFTLFLSLDAAADAGLSHEYISRLLQDEPFSATDHFDGFSNFNGSSGAVLTYPLYKHLARAIYRCIASGTFIRVHASMDGILLEESLDSRQSDWDVLIADKGSELLKMFDEVDFELHVQEPYFSQIRDGLKTVEGRCATGNYNRILPNASLLLNKCLALKVLHVKRYSSFYEMLQAENLGNALPGVKTIEEGVQIYRRFYNEEKEKSNGALAIYISRLSPQPYLVMADILTGLSFDGVGCLLGIVHTAGTVVDALPPAISTLVSSAIRPHRPYVKGCSLTVAARELTKHASRSTEEWWGCISGDDSNKNRLASEVIYRLLTECCWKNIHMVQPHGCVFEVRVPEGYGARWSKDGSEFIGFLEPYMEDGYSKKWKH